MVPTFFISSLEERLCYTGILIYTMLAFVLFLLITSSNTSLLGGEWSFIIVIGLFIVVLFSWVIMLFYAGIAFLVSIIIAGLLYLLGFNIGIELVFALIIFLTVASIVIYHLWTVGKILRTVSKKSHGVWKALQLVSGTAYTILAIIFMIIAIVLFIGSMPMYSISSEKAIEITDLEIDIAVAILGILLFLGKIGLGISMLIEESRAAKIAGALHLLGSITIIVLSYYLLGPLLHLPGAPNEPIPLEHILDYSFPATLLPIFALSGLFAWLSAVYAK